MKRPDITLPRVNLPEMKLSSLKPSQDMCWSFAAGAAGVLAGLAVQQVVEQGWRRTTDRDPPRNPASADVTWGNALAWAMVSGIAMALGHVVGRRAVAGAWRRRHPRPMAAWQR